MGLDLRGTVSLDGSGFQSGLDRLMKSADEFKQHIMGAFGASALIEFGRQVAEMAQQVKDLAEQNHTSTDEIQKWDAAAKKSGQTAEDFATALLHLKRSREAAIGGDIGAIENFGRLGISLDEIKDKTLSALDIIGRMYDRIGDTPVVDSMSVAAMELLGKKGDHILTIFKDLKELGPIQMMSPEELDRIDNSIKNMEAAKKNLKVTAAPAVGGIYELLAHSLGQGMAPFDLLAGKSGLSEALRKMLEIPIPKSWLPNTTTPGQAVNSAVSGMFIGANDLQSGTTQAAKTVHYYTSKVVDLSKEEAEYKKLSAELDELRAKSAFDLMTVEEKRAKLTAEIAKHEDAATRATYEGYDVLSAQESIKAEQARRELQSLDKAGLKTNSARPLLPESDALTRVGNFLGSGRDAISDIARQQVNILQLIERNTRPTKGFDFNADMGIPVV